MSLAHADFENLNETEIRVEATRVQCAMLEYPLGLKTASIQGAVKTGMYYGYQHILSGVARRREMTANGDYSYCDTQFYLAFH